MKIKTRQETAELQTSLTVSREEATRQIAERINRGDELKCRVIQTEQQFSEVQKEYWAWDKYNEEMLRQMFTTAKSADEYSPANYLFAIDRKPFEIQITDFRGEIEAKIGSLASITERLELIQMAPTHSHSQPHTEPTVSSRRGGVNMDTASLLTKLTELLENKSVVERYGPNSEAGQQWLTSAEVHLELVDTNLAAQFNYHKQLIVRRLSAATVRPFWTNMQGYLRTAIARLELETPQSQSKVYGPGEAYDVYRDLAEIMSNAKTETFVIDPYANEEVFTLYLDKIRGTVKMRLLTGTPSVGLKLVKTKFAARPNTQFEAKMSSEVHDRVIFIDCTECWVLGQSIKDAANKKPTYLISIPIPAVSDMSKLYEAIWQRATAY